jgi:hypothetical protein
MYRNFKLSAASILELLCDIMKFKLIVRYNFTWKIKTSVNTLQKQALNLRHSKKI